jgi:hypothetical protein
MTTIDNTITYTGPELDSDATLAIYADNPNWTLELSCDFGRREIGFDRRHEVDQHTTTAREWHGHARSWRVPIMVKADAQMVVDRVRGLMTRVCAGYSSEWDGSNHVARFTDAAQETLDEIDRYVENLEHTGRLTAAGGLWSAADWFEAEPPPEVWPDDTDADLEALADELQAEAHDEGVHVHDLEEYLREMRDEMRDDD